MKITERKINELKLHIKPIRNPINDIKFSMLINAIEQLNTANGKLDLNGLIVESYSQKNINPYSDVLSLEKYRELFGYRVHEFTGVDYIEYYKKIIEDEGCKCEVVFANQAKEILNSYSPIFKEIAERDFELILSAYKNDNFCQKCGAQLNRRNYEINLEKNNNSEQLFTNNSYIQNNL